jgi:hypothetical protein
MKKTKSATHTFTIQCFPNAWIVVASKGLEKSILHTSNVLLLTNLVVSIGPG